MIKEYDSVIAVKGIGPKKREHLNQLGIYTIHDLLNYYPSNYKDRGKYTDISDCADKKKYLIKGIYQGNGRTNFIRKKLNITLLPFQSGKTAFQVVFYNQPYRKNHFTVNQEYVLYGTVSFKNGAVFVVAPECEKSDSSHYLTEGLYPIYPHISSSPIRPKEIATYIKYALENTTFEHDIPDWIIDQIHLPSKETAYRSIHLFDKEHRPENGIQYIKFMKFLKFFLSLSQYRPSKKRSSENVLNTAILPEFIRAFDFELTKKQKEAIADIKRDVSSGESMNRLLQGDVGSGKTAVALCALILAAANHRQGVFTAPTEILAKQHYNKYKDMLRKFGFESVLLHGSLKQKERKEITEKLRNGNANIIFGTHAVFSNRVAYNDLALIVIDEQHRYGVSQRAALTAKGKAPHVLVMSATPIPRTLSLSFYKDLDVSILNEYPKGRKPVSTLIRDASSNEQIYTFIREQADNGLKTYIVCPAAKDESMTNVMTVYDELSEKFLPHRVGYLIGDMDEKEKNSAMSSFAFGNTMILIATTVIEVGMDVPDAVVIWIKDSERYGLAQLHQLRGRVGRSNKQSYCILQTESVSEKALKRLNILTKTNDGFKIAEKDMQLRGSGELYGIKQSGKTDTLLYDALANPDFFIAVDKLATKLLRSTEEKDIAFRKKTMERFSIITKDIVLN